MTERQTKDTRINLVLPKSLYDELKAAADRDYESISEFVRRSVVERIRRLDKEIAS